MLLINIKYISLPFDGLPNNSLPKSPFLKFIYSEKAAKFCEIFTLLLSYVVPVKSKVKISQNFVAFSEYMNFKKLCAILLIILYLCSTFLQINRKICKVLLHNKNIATLIITNHLCTIFSDFFLNVRCQTDTFLFSLCLLSLVLSHTTIWRKNLLLRYYYYFIDYFRFRLVPKYQNLVLIWRFWYQIGA